MKFSLSQEIRPDGAVWETIVTNNSYTMLTSVGRQLLHKNPSLIPQLAAYNHDLRHGGDETRRYLASGTQADVYSVGDTNLVVKEKRPDSDENLLESMRRLDAIKLALEHQAPRWVDTPDCYGFVQVFRPERQFLLMSKIDAGITVGDLLDYPKGVDSARNPTIYQKIGELFGDVIDDMPAVAAEKFKDMSRIVQAALANLHLPYDEHATDLEKNPWNTVVERLKTPIAGENFRFWVIDQ